MFSLKSPERRKSLIIVYAKTFSAEPYSLIPFDEDDIARRTVLLFVIVVFEHGFYLEKRLAANTQTLVPHKIQRHARVEKIRKKKCFRKTVLTVDREGRGGAIEVG